MSVDSTGESTDAVHERINALVSQLEETQARLDAQSAQIDDLRDDLNAEREERRNLERELQEREERIDDMRDEISRLDSRTDLLELVDDADEMDGTQRATVLIQHLHKKARARERNENPPTAKIDRDDAEKALHFPSELDRSTFYKDMDRAARLVGNEDLLEYDDGWLTLDLEAGDLPARFTGSPEVE